MNHEMYLKTFIDVCVGKRDFFWKYSNKNIPFLSRVMGIDQYLTDDILKNVLKGKETIGVTPFIDKDYVLYGAIDIDAHISDNDSFLKIAHKRKYADRRCKKYMEWLDNYGYKYFVNSSGSPCGWHIRVYSNKPCLAYVMRRFLENLQIECVGDVDDEVYPKQDNLSDEKPYGNQLKLPLSLHKKYNNNAVIYDKGKFLSIEESLSFIDSFHSEIPSAKTVKIDENTKTRIDEKKKPTYGDVDLETPEYCAVIEEVIAEKSVPSGYVTRHHYLDPNVNIYTFDKPDLRQRYKNTQKRTESSLKNWTRIHTSFNCSQIHSYLREYKSNPVIQECIKRCEECEYNNTTKQL